MSSGQAREHSAEADAPEAAPVEPAKPQAAASTPQRPAAATRPSTANDRNLHLRQTVIPPLLTMGTLMPLLGLVSLLLGDESPLGESKLVPVLLIVVGLLILGMAAMNMLQVRQQLSASAKR